MTKITDQIQQILERWLFMARYSKKYKYLYNKKKEASRAQYSKFANRTIIIMQNVLYAQESILCLKTLFSKNTDEACFNALLKDKHTSNKYTEYKVLEDEYNSTTLNAFRDKIIAHKDSKNIGDPITAYFGPIEDKWLDKIIYFYEELNTFLHKNFDVIENDLFESWYKKSFNYLYKKLDQDDE